MSIQILPPEQPSPLAQLLTGASQGLGEGLQQFFQKKREREGSKKLAEILGLEGKQAEAFQSLNPEQQKLAAKFGLFSRFFPDAGAQTKQDLGEDLATGDIAQPAVAPQISNQAIASLSLFEPQTARILQQQKKLDVTERRASHNDSKEFFNKTTSAADSAQETLDALDLQEEAIKSGKLGRLSAPALADAVGLQFIKRFVETPESKAFKTASKQMFTEAKDFFGARPLGFEIQMMKQMQAEIGVREEANLATISTLKKNARLRGLKGEIARELTEANGGLRPQNFEAHVNREFQKKRGAIKNDWTAEMRSAGFGKDVKSTDIKLNSVPAGTPVNDQIADLILFKANGNVKNAESLARQLGYTF